MPAITANVVPVFLSPDCVEAIRLITRVDFQTTQCVPSAKAYTLAKKIHNFLAVRHVHEYTKFMRYYNLDELADNRSILEGVANEFAAAHQNDCGVVVILQ